MIYHQSQNKNNHYRKLDCWARLCYNDLLNSLSFWQKVSCYLLTAAFYLLNAAIDRPGVGRELNQSLAIANSLLADVTEISQVSPPGEINRPIIKLGSSGADVSELQAVLKLLGYYTGAVDGAFTERMAIAVSLFQQAAGLEADGIVGADTWNRLFPPVSFIPPSETNSPAAISPPSSVPTPENLPMLSRGMSGPDVKRLQERLRANGFFQGNATGNFGPKTEAAAIAAQQHYGLQADGIVGPATWRVLLP